MNWALFLFSLFAFLRISALSIAIVTGKTGVGTWDPDSVKKGITGSEEAVIYISQKLADEGGSVIVYAPTPENSPYGTAQSNPRYVNFDYHPNPLFDVVIAWRMPEIGELLKQYGKKVFFWPHDLCSTRLTQYQIDQFDDVLWLSESQREQWCSINPGMAKFTKIFGNGINPEQFEEIQPRENPYSCIYASSYSRGLSHLLDIWPVVKKHYPQATLDIYYGWQSWASTPPQVENRMKAQIQSLRFLGVQEHGQVGHLELHRAYAKASLWTYPCTALITETFCISALKAQFAGAIPVIIDGSALKETVRHGFRCSTPEQYLSTLLEAMSTIEKTTLEERQKQRSFILQEYTWQIMAQRWKSLFDSHLSQ